MHNLVNLNFEDLFHINRGRITRGHELRLLRENSKVLARSNNFCCRPLKIWNSLDASVAEAKSLYVFKSLLNTVNFEKFLLVRDWIILCLFNCIIVFKIVIVIVLNFSFTFTVFYYIILNWIGELWASYDLSLLWHSLYLFYILSTLYSKFHVMIVSINDFYVMWNIASRNYDVLTTLFRLYGSTVNSTMSSRYTACVNDLVVHLSLLDL